MTWMQVMLDDLNSMSQPFAKAGIWQSLGF